MNHYIMKTLDPTFKGAVAERVCSILYRNSINKQNFTLKMLNEVLVSYQIVFFFSRNFYLLDEFNEKLSQFQANGLLNFWRSNYMSSASEKLAIIPSSLDLMQLRGVFTLYMFGLLCACAALLSELTFKCFKRIF